MGELRNHPQFTQLAQTVLQNPQVLPQILPVLAQTNPEIARAIQENPQELMRLLQEAAGGGGGGAGGPPMPGATGGAPQAGRGGPQLSEEESAAVQRLADLGFPRHAAVQAY